MAAVASDAREAISAAARRVAEVIAPDLEQQLHAIYGPGWLDTVNAQRAEAGFRPGRGLQDHRFCLAMFGHDPATVGWAEESRRKLARELNALANRASHDESLAPADVTRAVQIADWFAAPRQEPASASSQPPGAVHPGALAAQLLEAGDLKAAERANQEWMALEPQNSAAAGQQFLIYRAADRWEDALAAVTRWQQLDPSLRLNGAFAQAFFWLKRWGEAVDPARRWAGDQPSNPDAWKLMFAAATRSGDPEAAEEAARGWVTAEPDQSLAWQRWSEQLMQTDRWDEAVEATKRWCDLEPSSNLARQRHLIALRGARRSEDILALLDKGWFEIEGSPGMSVIKAQSLAAVGRHSEAVAAAARATNEDDSLVEGWRVQARSLYELGHLDGSAAAARRILRDRPEDEDAWYRLVEAFLDAKRWEELLEATEGWIKVCPRPRAWSGKVLALLGLRRWSEARETAEMLYALAPDEPNALDLLVRATAGGGELTKALDYAKRWVELAPDSTDARAALDRLQAAASQRAPRD